jgi:Arc/MetJ-type ribon-helix-helix transcriptional regulator
MRTPGGLVRTVLYLPEELKEALRDLAHRERRSESDVLRQALRELLDRLAGEE